MNSKSMSHTRTAPCGLDKLVVDGGINGMT
jgi:hypothetical protein